MKYEVEFCAPCVGVEAGSPEQAVEMARDALRGFPFQVEAVSAGWPAEMKAFPIEGKEKGKR
jgi:hypothetical protein